MPCLLCGQRFEGTALNAYAQFYEGDDQLAFRFVGCHDCWRSLQEPWEQHCLCRDADGEWQLPLPGIPPVPSKRPPEPSGRARRRKEV